MIIGYSRVFASSGPPTTNLTAQFDTSSLSYLWKTISAADPCYSNQASADGDAIAGVSSASPAGSYVLSDDNIGTQATTLKITSPGLNHQCIAFDGSSDWLGISVKALNGFSTYATFFSSTAMTMFISFRPTAVPGAGSFAPLMFDTSGNFYGMRIDGSASPKLGYYGHDGSFRGGTGSTTIAINTNYVAMMQHDSTTIYGAVNNGTVDTFACGTQSHTTTRFAIGADTGPGFFFTGRIGEILMYNAVLSGTDLTNAWNYMQNKWL